MKSVVSVAILTVMGLARVGNAAEVRPTLAIIAAEDEYQSERTLPDFARAELDRNYRVIYVFADPRDHDNLPGLVEALEQADVALFCIRRKGLPVAQLNAVRRFVAAGKGVIGVRTAPHSFAPFANRPRPVDRVFWPEFDREVLGCVYNNHHRPAETVVRVIPEAAREPVLKGIAADASAKLPSTLYKVLPLAAGATPLLTGTTPGVAPEPVAWIWTRPDGGRSFVTTLGHPDEFANPLFRRLLNNGIDWAARRPLNP